jgi:arylsulfatase A-like enzyme
MFEHRYAMWDDLLHVPLVIRYPRAFPAGKRVQERVTTADVFSTVIELAGLPAVEGVASTSLVGRTTFEPFVVAQMLDPFSFMMSRMHELYPEVDMKPYTRTYCAAWQGDWKLIYGSDDHHHLFDTATDPGELVDRYASETAKAGELEAGLAAWEGRLVVHDPELRDEQDRRMVLKHEARQSGGAPEGPDAEMLKQLGYAGSGNLGVPQLYPTFCGPRRPE